MASSISSSVASFVVDPISAGQNMSLTPGILAANEAAANRAALQAVQAVQASTSAQAAATTASPVVTTCSGSSAELHSNTVQLPLLGVQPRSQVFSLPSDGLGRSSLFVPSFVNTFTLPPVATALPAMGSLSTTCASFGVWVTSVPPHPAPVLYQPFVVGPGFSPIPAKLAVQFSERTNSGQFRSGRG